MLEVYIFSIISAMTIAASVLVTASKKLLYSAIFLAIAFLGSALLFFLIGQTMIALLQLIVFVGGLSTFLIVSIASENKLPRLINLWHFVAVAVILFAAIFYTTSAFMPYTSASPSNFLDVASAALSTGYAVFYIMAMLLFAVALSGVFIIKKFTKLLV
jgi:NADH:ubiquinone oxidoreductase subunit 6 (subunit J)